MRHTLRRFVALAGAVASAVAGAGRAEAHGILVGDGAHGEVRLTAHRVTATVKDRVADVVVEQTFHSDATRVLEGTYVFPLPQGAAVAKFAMTMGDAMVEGEVVEAKQARRVYEGIVAKRRDPGLLEWVGSGLFRARVFPIEPGKDLTIRLRFQQLLEEDAGTLLWRYPLSTDRLGGPSSAVVEVTADVESTVDLKAVYCPSHEVAVARDGERKARVTHARRGGRQDRDFLLYLGRSPEDVGVSVVSGKAVAEDGTFLAVLAPRVAVDDARRVPVDVVYVLDTSGSMQGEKIVQARAALAYGLRRLRPDDRFAVLGFATGVRAFRDGFVAAAPATVEAAVAWLDGLSAEGGTNIDGALAEALRLRSAERLPMIVFLTDGEPTVGETRTDALVRGVAARNASKARIFTFGVGGGLDVPLLDRIAGECGGAREYVGAGESIEVATGRFFRKVDRPVLTDVAVDFGGGVHDVYPNRLPDLFAGEQVVVFGRYTTAGPRVVTLKGRVGGQELALPYTVTFSEAPGPDLLPRLWAHRKVAYLLDELRLRGQNAELVDEVTRLATRHAIVTPYTSGLVVERDGAVVSAAPTVRDASSADHNETDADLPSEEALGEGGLDDAPFEGPANNGLVGIGGSAGGAAFQGRGGHRNLRGGGGGRRTDDAVDAALKWLAAHQAPDGGWDARDAHGWCDGRPRADDVATGAAAARPARRVGATSRALAAFLCAGFTHRSDGPFGPVVTRALRFLRAAQGADGFVGERDVASSLVDHAYATLALVEAHGMTGSESMRTLASAALLALRAGQASDGSFGSPEATAAAALAFESAWRVASAAWRQGRPSAFDGEAEWIPASLEAVLAWAEKGRAAGEPTAAALELLLGVTLRGAVATDAAVVVERALPAQAAPMGAADALAWDLGLLALRRVGGSSWQVGEKALRRVVDAWHRDTDYCVSKGAWDAADDLALGRVGSTAVGALACGVFHRYEAGIPSRSAFLRTRPPVSMVPANDAETSRALRDAKDATSVGDAGGALRTVAGRTFRRDAKGRFVETTWDGAKAPVAVEAFSPRYFALSATSDEVARILSLGERVVFVHEGEVLEVVPAAAEAPPVK